MSNPDFGRFLFRKAIVGDSERKAWFSFDGLQRFKLAIRWDETKPTLYVIGMNPSIANESRNDPTVERCERRARALGYGRLIMLNAIPWISTDPRGMEGVSPDFGMNRKYITEALSNSRIYKSKILCAWGNNRIVADSGMPEWIKDMAAQCGVPLYCLGTNKNGSPKHPLYQPYSAGLVRWPRKE